MERGRERERGGKGEEGQEGKKGRGGKLEQGCRLAKAGPVYEVMYELVPKCMTLNNL